LQLSLKDIDLGFAGRYALTRPVHAAIANLQPGDPLLLKKSDKAWELTNADGQAVCRLARSFSPPAGKQLVSAKVFALVVRERDDSEPKYQDVLRTERWEVVIPELVYG
jgi:ATP-dependent DNA helicase RecQ